MNVSRWVATIVFFATSVLMGCGAGEPAYQPAFSNDTTTWFDDVLPLVQTYCLGCHQEGGNTPMVFDTYENVRPFAAAMRLAVASRTMPPYYMINDGSCGDFTSPWLTESEINVFVNWAEDGYLEGNPADAPPPFVPSEGLGSEATSFTMNEPYTPVVFGNSDAPKDDYRCFVLSEGQDKDVFVTALESVASDPKLVHHVIAYTLDPDKIVALDEQGVAITNREVIDELQADDERPGWQCYGSTGEGTSPNSQLGAWLPGAGPMRLPAGSGISWRGGEWLVVQLHYNLDNGPGEDQSSVRMILADEVEKQGFFVIPDGLFQTLGLGDPFVIEPGEESVFFQWVGTAQELTEFIQDHYPTYFDPIPTAFEILAVQPHMHALGASYNVQLREGATGTPQCITNMDQWDFNWQHLYFYETPQYMGPNHQAVVTCEYNSTGRTEPTYPGVDAENEMCLFTMFFTPTRER